MKEVIFEGINEVVEASEDFLRPLIGRKLKDSEKELVKNYFTHYFELSTKKTHITLSERQWLIYTNRLTTLFDDQIKIFDAILDSVVLLKSKDPNVIFGYSEDGAKIEQYI